MTCLSYKLVGETRAPVFDPNPPEFFGCTQWCYVSRFAGWFAGDFGNWVLSSWRRTWWF